MVILLLFFNELIVIVVPLIEMCLGYVYLDSFIDYSPYLELLYRPLVINLLLALFLDLFYDQILMITIITIQAQGHYLILYFCASWTVDVSSIFFARTTQVAVT